MTCFVYVLKCERTGLIKVGVSNVPKLRLLSGIRVKVIDSVEMPSRKLAVQAEKLTHVRLGKRRTLHPKVETDGALEWFDVNSKRAVVAVRTCCQEVMSKVNRGSKLIGSSHKSSNGAAMPMVEFSLLVGMTRQGVMKAIRSGRIPASCYTIDQRGSRQKVTFTDPTGAVAAWVNNTNCHVARELSREKLLESAPQEIREAIAYREIARGKLNEIRAKRIHLRDLRRNDVVGSFMNTLHQVCQEVLEEARDRRAAKVIVDKVKVRVQEEIT